MEVTIVNFFWQFDFSLPYITLQVIWAIGISMVIFGLLMLAKFPFWAILTIGLLITGLHNIADVYEMQPTYQPGLIGTIVHFGGKLPSNANHTIMVAYPFLPWLGLMMLGYCMGKIFTKEYSSARRFKILVLTGTSLLAIFILLRYINVYGDPMPWEKGKNSLFTFLSFMNVWKYPPSLLYVCATMGPALIALAFLEKIENSVTHFFNVFGRTAFFYYLLHVALIHLLALTFNHNRKGFDLPMVYLFWIITVLLLYPLCYYYDKYKQNHKEKIWLSYL